MSKGRIAWLALCLAACSLEGRSTARLEAEPSRAAAGASAAGPPGSARDAELEAFVGRVVLDADQSWAADFKRRNKPYQAARAVTFTEREPNTCARVGLVPAAGCEGSSAVYVDLDFQRALQKRYGEEEAAAPQAYALAHAMGHHVQKVLGLDRKAAELVRERPVAAHSVELQLELQADCLAGVWARVSKIGALPRERVEEALKQASEVGNEQRLARGDQARPLETFTYAIPRRRLYWFAKGYGTAKVEDCDPFASE
jgi:predicted metalloprotease